MTFSAISLKTIMYTRTCLLPESDVFGNGKESNWLFIYENYLLSPVKRENTGAPELLNNL